MIGKRLTREEAIGELSALAERMDSEVLFVEVSDISREAVEAGIEALQERKAGKWIITARNGVLCSECKSGTRKMPMLFGNPLYKYCPFCGIKMEGKDADSN